jgi:hypothetical protein
MSRAVRYRRYAAQCIQLAKELDVSSHKARALNMAEHWRRLADHAETIDNRLAGLDGQVSDPSDPSLSPD